MPENFASGPGEMKASAVASITFKYSICMDFSGLAICLFPPLVTRMIRAKVPPKAYGGYLAFFKMVSAANSSLMKALIQCCSLAGKVNPKPANFCFHVSPKY
jgi:hypothetical protein